MTSKVLRRVKLPEMREKCKTSKFFCKAFDELNTQI
jgi:hypothetical protein